MAASEAAREIETLLGLHPKGFDLSLDRITRLLAALGDPQWGKLHLFDGLGVKLRTITIAKDPECRACGSAGQ